MKEKNLKNLRQDFKEKGIFYTPKALAERLKSYADNDPKTVYDPTCGAGNLLSVWPAEVQTYGQELDPEQLALVDHPNFTGRAGDTLLDDQFAGMLFDCIVANPPFSNKWNPDALKDDPRFTVCPTMPPPSKADWAFMLHIIAHLADDGVAVTLAFPGILYRGQREGQVRKWFVDQNYIDRIVEVPGNTFADTSITTCIVVLKKNRTDTGITFEREGLTREVPLDEISQNSYNLSPSSYIQPEEEKEAIDIDAVNREVVSGLLRQIRSTIRGLLALQEVFPGENLYIPELRDGLQDILREYGWQERTTDKLERR